MSVPFFGRFAVVLSVCVTPACLATIHAEDDLEEASASGASPAGPHDDDAAPVRDDETVSEDKIQEQTLLLISPHEPVYFALGFNDRTNARFQLGFKFRFVNRHGELSRQAPTFFDHLYFGYAQTVLWDLQSDSTPFLDSTYRPSLFWRDERLESWSDDTREVSLETGFEHESNGKDDPESRSVNTVYAKPAWDWTLQSGLHAVVEPKVWAYIGKSDNPDIDDYRGFFDLRLELFDPEGFGISSNMRLGRDPHHGYLEVDATYPMRRLFSGDLEGFLLVQYVNGWGESIIAYDEKSPAQVRIGFALVR